MSFNFIKLENRKYELTPSTSEPLGPLAQDGGGGGGGGSSEDDAGPGSSISSSGSRRQLEGRRLHDV